MPTCPKWLDRLCQNVGIWSRLNPIKWETLRFGLIVGPLTLLALANYHFDNAQPEWHKGLKSWFDGSLIVLGSIVVLPGLITLLTDIAIKRADKISRTLDIGSASVTTVLTAINHFVGEKMKRFGECAKKTEVRTASFTKAQVFAEITQPEEQIKEIVKQLYFVVRRLTNDDSLKIVLVELAKGATPVYSYYLPGDQHPSLGLLSEKNWHQSFFAEVSRGTKARVIADIGKHVRSKRAASKKYFFPSSSDRDDEGSIIGFPIINPILQRTTHVLTLRSDNPGHLGDEFKTTYRKYVEFFFTRIHLEYSLKIIKDAAA